MPSSSRAAERPSPSRVPPGPRPDELASLYRKIADLQTELSDAESRLTRAVTESAGADEMVGQMLARVSEVEARLHESEVAHAESIEALEVSEERAAELAARLEEALAEAGRVAGELAAERIEGERAVAEREARAQEAAALRARLTREQEERETLGLRVGELTKVCEERDDALVREEELEADLVAARAEIVALRAAATPAAACAEEGPAELAGARAGHDGGDPQPPGSAERDALATEARCLRAAVASMRRVLSELDQGLASPQSAEETAPASTETATPRDGGEDTKVFGAREMLLVRESARRRG